MASTPVVAPERASVSLTGSRKLPRSDHVMQKLPRVYHGIESLACDEHRDLPQADVAAGECRLTLLRFHPCFAKRASPGIELLPDEAPEFLGGRARELHALAFDLLAHPRKLHGRIDLFV